MKIINYAMGFVFIGIAALFFTFGEETSIGRTHPYTAVHTLGMLFWVTGFMVIAIYKNQYKGGIASWFGMLFLFVAIFSLSKQIEAHLTTNAQFNYVPLFTGSIATLLLLYGYKQHKRFKGISKIT